MTVLDPAALLAQLPSLLPDDDKNLLSPQDALAALLHTALVALGFRLALPSNVLPSTWNKQGPAHYQLAYKHNQSSLNFSINISKLAKRTLIAAIPDESDALATLDISTDDFTSPSAFPASVTVPDPPLVYAYISSNRVADLMSRFKLQIVSKLMPDIEKQGSSTSSAPPPATPSQTTPNPRPEHPPDAPAYDPLRIPSHPRINPYEIGRRDLDPFPPNPFAPPSVFPHGGDDGMLVGPSHPIFGSRRGGDLPMPGMGPWGGDGFLPPMGAPPGARFDPVGPGMGPPGGGPRRLPRHNPDNDEFMPPGMGDMYM